MKGKNSEYFKDLHLHDLEAYYLDAYESAVRIYNDMVEKHGLPIFQMSNKQSRRL
ncbi:MAG: hypothetical protein CM15mP54_09690 [Paracoccaceae bacterium]|nr:MAG: hypothetical protein CM15mP54_09690 [Paracoccaceae bacterium]